MQSCGRRGGNLGVSGVRVERLRFRDWRLAFREQEFGGFGIGVWGFGAWGWGFQTCFQAHNDGYTVHRYVYLGSLKP